MNNEKQIVLFLAPNTTFSEVKLAADIFEKFPALESPITIPYNEKNPNNPLIIFNHGIMSLTMNRNDVSFIFKRNTEKECDEIVNGTMEILEDYNIKSTRLGYVSTYFNTKKDRTKFIENTFKEKDTIGDEFNLAWYKNELIDSVRVNVWERHLTDSVNKVDYVTVFDINTPREEEYNISSSFVEDFIKECDKYIKKKLDERF